MDFGGTGPSCPTFFDPAVLAEMSATMPRFGTEWDAANSGQPSSSTFNAFNSTQALPYPHIGGDLGFAGFGAASGIVGIDAPKSVLGGSPSTGLLAIAQSSTRAARNGREQQRAQRISDIIDRLKVRRVANGMSFPYFTRFSLKNRRPRVVQKLKCLRPIESNHKLRYFFAVF